MGILNLLGDQLFDRRTHRNTFERPGLGIEPLQRAKFLVAAKLRLLHGRLQNANGFVIDFNRYGIGMPVLAPVGERKPRGSEKRNGAPWTTSATIARACTVRAPTPGVSNNSGKSFGPRSAAAARLPCSRRAITSLPRTSWWEGMIRRGRFCCACGAEALGSRGLSAANS